MRAILCFGLLFDRQSGLQPRGIAAGEVVRLVEALRAQRRNPAAGLSFNQINGDLVRVSSKSIDTLQECIAFLKQSNVGIPIQFTNMRP